MSRPSPSEAEDLDPRFCPKCGNHVTPYSRATTRKGVRIRYRVCKCGAKWRSAEVRVPARSEGLQVVPPS